MAVTTIYCVLFTVMCWTHRSITFAGITIDIMVNKLNYLYFLDFVEKPTSVNATQGSVAVFNCTGYSQSFHWLVNNRLPEHDKNLHRGLKKINITVDPGTNLKIHLLLIPAEPKNNGVNIKCLIYNISQNSQAVISDLVYLHVQGMLLIYTRYINN